MSVRVDVLLKGTARPPLSSDTHVHALPLRIALALAAWAITACSGSGDPTPHPQVTASDSEVHLVGPDDADLLLYVSNRSFEDENVRLKLAVDGVMVVDGEFRVEGSTTGSGSP